MKNSAKWILIALLIGVLFGVAIGVLFINF